MYDIIVWIAQGFLAVFFLAAGLPKVIGRGIDRWVGFDAVPRPLTVVIGVSEVAAAIALVVPQLVGAFEWAAPLAAIGVAIISLMASGFHVRNTEWLAALETALWAALAGSIAIARWGLIATGPSISDDVLIPVLVVLVPGIIVNLVVLTRSTAPSRTDAARRVPATSN